MDSILKHKYYYYYSIVIVLIYFSTSVMQGIFGASLTSQCIEHRVFQFLIQRVFVSA